MERLSTYQVVQNSGPSSITDGSQYVARLAIYPSDYSKVRQGSAVTLRLAGEDMALTSSISFLEPQVRQDQARLVWAKLPNSGAQLLEGGFVAAAIEVATITVPLAVKKTGLQAFRDFTVVYARVGDEYEVRMLTLGRTDDLWVEVLGGLPAGTEYVTRNSYILKADIEKSGASHDH
jgi:membrane fusion protein, heavy metal efflux system